MTSLLAKKLAKPDTMLEETNPGADADSSEQIDLGWKVPQESRKNKRKRASMDGDTQSAEATTSERREVAKVK